MYFSLFDVTLAYLITSVYFFKYFSLLKILQRYAEPKIDIITVIQTHHEGFYRLQYSVLLNTVHCRSFLS
jgi:hypothetical protein